MGKRYDEREVINLYKDSVELKSIDQLYKKKFINWKGKTQDTDSYYSEVIASKLVEDLSIFEEITKVSRDTSYKTDSHSKIEIDLESNRHEEQFAKRVMGLDFENLGKITDFQVPLKNIRKDDSGKIDLISINDKEKKVFLI